MSVWPIGPPAAGERVKLKFYFDFLCSNPALEIYTLNVRFVCAAPGRWAGGGGGAEGEARPAHPAAPSADAPHCAASLCAEGATCKSLSCKFK
jgi:hypothetical protein